MKYTHIEGDNIVIYHKNCNDGFGAALVCSTILKKKNTEYHSAVHYSDPPDVKGKNVFILDFSYLVNASRAINGTNPLANTMRFSMTWNFGDPKTSIN